MKNRVQGLSGARLDFWTARALGFRARIVKGECIAERDGKTGKFSPSTRPEDGHGLIDRFKVRIAHCAGPAVFIGELVDGDHVLAAAEAHPHINSMGRSSLEATCKTVVESVYGLFVPVEDEGE